VVPCPFCELASGADEDLVALRTQDAFVVPVTHQRRLNRGHVLVLPARHVTRLADAEPALLAEVYSVAGRVSMAVRTAFGATGSTIFQNDESPDQVLMHLHVHVVPRRAGDGFTMPAAAKDELTRAERCEQAAALRRALAP
jgi:histidine triad (HIT) family protein